MLFDFSEYSMTYKIRNTSDDIINEGSSQNAVLELSISLSVSFVKKCPAYIWWNKPSYWWW